MVEDNALQEALAGVGGELEVPGAAVGVLAGNEERYAFHGVTSVENPLVVDDSTLFQFGSTGKTFTATAMMRLVEEGKVDLDATVRTYVPELQLKDEDVARRVTVMQLLNHTAGWTGDRLDNTGDGDDAISRYVELMATFDQVSPLGSEVSYNNASVILAGRIIEKVTGSTYEHAMRELVLDPLGLAHTFFFPNEIMTRRFVVGHTRHDDGRVTINRPWAMPRACAPAGGMSATAENQIRWARFHLGDGTPLVKQETLHRMQQPTAHMPGSALGDAVGISWLLRDIGGTCLVAHGGSTNGQYSDFVLVPDRNFAFVSMTNCGPNGSQLNHRLQAWALEHYLGIVEAEPEPIPLDGDDAKPYLGRYETVAAIIEITADAGRLAASVSIKPEMAAALREAGEDDPKEQPPVLLSMLPGDGDRFVATEGPAKGLKGYFRRDAAGAVDGVHLGGRVATRVQTDA